MRGKIIKKILAAIATTTIFITPNLACAAPPKKHLAKTQPNQPPNFEFEALCQISNLELDDLLEKSVNTADEKKGFAKAAKNFAKTRLLSRCSEDKLGVLAHMLGECSDNLDAQKDIFSALSHLVNGKLSKSNSKIEIKEIINILHICHLNSELEDSLRAVCGLTYLSYEAKSTNEIEKLIDILEKCSYAENFKGEVARIVKELIAKENVGKSSNSDVYKISDNCISKIQNILDRCSNKESAKENVEYAKIALNNIKSAKFSK